MSVSSRPVGCRMSAPPSAFAQKEFKFDQNDAPKLHNRLEFHETFSNLIKLGSVDKQDKNCKRAVIFISRVEFNRILNAQFFLSFL